MKLTGENRQLGEKPLPVPVCPPQISHGLTRDRTRASAVRGRRLTAWAIPRPYPVIYFQFCLFIKHIFFKWHSENYLTVRNFLCFLLLFYISFCLFCCCNVHKILNILCFIFTYVCLSLHLSIINVLFLSLMYIACVDFPPLIHVCAISVIGPRPVRSERE